MFNPFCDQIEWPIGVVDNNDVPSECVLGTRSLDDKPAEWYDEERDHNEYQHLLERLYVQGVRAVRLA